MKGLLLTALVLTMLWWWFQWKHHKFIFEGCSHGVLKIFLKGNIWAYLPPPNTVTTDS